MLGLLFQLRHLSDADPKQKFYLLKTNKRVCSTFIALEACLLQEIDEEKDKQQDYQNNAKNLKFSY